MTNNHKTLLTITIDVFLPDDVDFDDSLIATSNIVGRLKGALASKDNELVRGSDRMIKVGLRRGPELPPEQGRPNVMPFERYHRIYKGHLLTDG